MQRITSEIAKQDKARIKAYLDVITKANPESLQEVLRMSDGTLTLDKIFEEAGLVAKWEARGEARGKAIGKAIGEEEKAAEIAKNLLRDGLSEEQTAKSTGLDIAKIRALSDAL